MQTQTLDSACDQNIPKQVSNSYECEIFSESEGGSCHCPKEAIISWEHAEERASYLYRAEAQASLSLCIKPSVFREIHT